MHLDGPKVASICRLTVVGEKRLPIICTAMARREYVQPWLEEEKKKGSVRGHPDLNQGPLDLQSNALPLSYTPNP